MEPVVLRNYIQPLVSAEKNVQFSKQIIKTATTVDNSVSIALKDMLELSGFSIDNKKSSENENYKIKESKPEGSDNENLNEDALVGIDGENEIEIEDDETLSDEVYEENNFIDIYFDEEDELLLEGEVMDEESVLVGEESKMLEETGTEEKEVTEAEINENISVQSEAKNLSSELIKNIVVDSKEKINIDEIVEQHKDLLKDVFIFLNKEKIQITSAENPNLTLRFTIDTTTNEFIIPLNSTLNLNPGDVWTNPETGEQLVVRYETDKEAKEFEKNWSGFQIALQRQAAEQQKIKADSKTETKTDDKKDLKEGSAENRVKVDGKTSDSAKNAVEILNEIKKNEMRRLALSTLSDRSISKKQKAEKQRDAEDVEKEELKKMLNNKTIKNEMIKTDAEVFANKNSMLIFQDIKSALNKPHIYLSVDHELNKLNIKTKRKS